VSEPGVLDASALLALLGGEPGAHLVAAQVGLACISAVNHGEVVSKLRDRGLALDEAVEALDALALEVVPVDRALAVRAGDLRPATKPFGLSLGDRVCLALAAALGRPALTAERTWDGRVEAATGARIVRIR